MLDFLTYELDRTSFWVGFITGILFFWILNQVRSLLPRLLRSLQRQFQSLRESLTTGLENRLRNEILSYAQGSHLASVFFPLDEVLIPPKILAPPLSAEVNTDFSYDDITTESIPYMPDWPEMGSFYGSPRLSLAEALQGGSNLLLMGRPGYGKTVALAHLASQLARQDNETSHINEYVPLFIHIADLLPHLSNKNPAEAVSNALSNHTSTIIQARLPNLIRNLLNNGKALLLLDGLDELGSEALQEIKAYLEYLLKSYPNLRLVISVSPDNYAGLNNLGLVPVALATWDKYSRSAFIKRWGQLWQDFIDPNAIQLPDYIDPLLLTNWLDRADPAATPLTLTLKTWAAFAGDVIGTDTPAQIEAHLQRLTVSIPNAQKALERLAFQMVYNQKPIVPLREAAKLVSEFEGITVKSDLEETSGKRADERIGGTSHILNRLIDSGLLANFGGDRVKIIHPLLLGYLAARAPSETNDKGYIFDQLTWAGKEETLAFQGCFADVSTFASEAINLSQQDPLRLSLLRAGRWLQVTPPDLPWRSTLMRSLASVMQKDHETVNLTARYATILAVSGDPGASSLFRQLLKANHPYLRHSAALGAGLIGDVKAIPDLTALLEDTSPTTGRAACLALVNIGTMAALDQVMTTLLHSTEEMRRAAAEALANHPEEGHQALMDGSQLDDLLVRRAVVFGMQRLKREDILPILEKMAIQDAQWVVRSVANQALEQMKLPNPFIPRSLPILTETPWLISYAAKQGLGVANTKQALEFVVQALEQGDDREQNQAITYLTQFTNESVVPRLYHLFYQSQEHLHEVIFNTLWHFAASGIPLPSPIQFGLG